MANYNIKVEDILKKFYDIQTDKDIKGLYEVRKLGDTSGKLLWYFFSSNNATYHSSANDCIIRDINQTNSGYIGRLKEAFEKAKKENKKIFWLVLVFGEGIGLPPADYDWIASVELMVSIENITASLRMKRFPVGKGRAGYIPPCYIRIDQDKYFNTTFISCKDEEGNYTSKFMDDYFSIYDNRPYHDVIEINDTEEDKMNDKETSRATGASNILLYGVPGSGKSYEIKTKYCPDARLMERVVFHPDYTYSDFVGQILPRVINEKLEYIFTPGPFTRMLKKAENDPGHMYYLVVEELNRGNAPAIFGEIFQLLDRKEKGEYPDNEVGESEYGISNYDVALEVYGDADRQVKVPSNMSILATMNTADQNIFTLDTAFQRRWDMCHIENNVLAARHARERITDTDISWGAFALVINNKIIDVNVDMASSEDKRLGAYFIKERELTVDKFPQKVLKYLWDDAFKMEKDSVFKSEYKSLEDVIGAYEKASGDRLGTVLRAEVYNEMVSKMGSLD